MTVSAMNMVSYCHGKAQGGKLTTWPVRTGMMDLREPEDNRLFASLLGKRGHSGEMEHPSIITIPIIIACACQDPGVSAAISIPSPYPPVRSPSSDNT